MNSKPLQIIQEITIPTAIDKVWEFLLNEKKMKQWLHANEFVIDVYEGGNIEIPLSFDGENCLVEGEIGLVIPKKKFAFTWIERDDYGETWFNNTMVTIELEVVESGTKLSLKHDGFKYLSENIQASVYHKYQAFWKEQNFLTRLQSLIMDTKRTTDENP